MSLSLKTGLRSLKDISGWERFLLLYRWRGGKLVWPGEQIKSLGKRWEEEGFKVIIK